MPKLTALFAQDLPFKDNYLTLCSFMGHVDMFHYLAARYPQIVEQRESEMVDSILKASGSFTMLKGLLLLGHTTEAYTDKLLPLLAYHGEGELLKKLSSSSSLLKYKGEIIFQALKSGSFKMLDFLFKQGFTLKPANLTGLEKGDKAFFQLLNTQIDLSDICSTTLKWLIKFNRHQSAHALLNVMKKSAFSPELMEVAFNEAITKNYVECVKILLDYSMVDTNKNCGKSLCLAAEFGNKEMVYLLIEKGTQYEPYNYKAIKVALKNKQHEIAFYLYLNAKKHTSAKKAIQNVMTPTMAQMINAHELKKSWIEIYHQKPKVHSHKSKEKFNLLIMRSSG